MNFVHTQIRRYLFGHSFGVAGQHDRLFHACLLQSGDGGLGIGLLNIRNENVSRIFAVDGYMNDSANRVAVRIRDPQTGH